MNKLYDKMLNKRNFENLDVKQIEEIYQVSSHDLENEEAEVRLSFFGENKLPKVKKRVS